MGVERRGTITNIRNGVRGAACKGADSSKARSHVRIVRAVPQRVAEGRLPNAFNVFRLAE